MKIFLVRHGMDEDGYRGGWSSRGLVEQGVVQSKKLAAYLVQHAEDYHIQTILSSNLIRAAETAKEIEQSLQIKATYSDEWREMNNGILAGIPNKEAEERFPGVYFNTLQMDTPFPGGETPTHFYTRIKQAFEHLCHQLENQTVQSNVLLITHGGVINVLYYVLSGEEWTNKSSFYPIDHTSVHTVEKRLSRWVMTVKNQTNHL